MSLLVFPDQRPQLSEIDAEKARREAYKVARYFPDCLPDCKAGSPHIADHVVRVPGYPPLCRALYQKSLQFFRAARPNANGYPTHLERLFLAANRIGKTETAGFEVTHHLTGDYPHWWQGWKFQGPIEAWAAGDTMQTTRDILQVSLMGPHEGVPLGQWRGMIPAHLITDVTRKSGGVSNCLDTIYIQHVEKHHGAPLTSALQFKSYDQGRRVFQGTEKHLIWLDEEPPDGAERAEAEAQGSSEIYTECLLRTMTTRGLILSTFTPLRGLTPFLINYLENAMMPDAETGLLDVAAKANFYPDLLGATEVDADDEAAS